MSTSPGPWFADTPTKWINPIRCANGMMVADVGFRENLSESMDNARLISAAPDLLEALIDLKKEYDMYVGKYTAKADAAIAKATGK